MATINDIGVAGQPLATPPLTAWQAAVRDAINGHGAWSSFVPTIGGAVYSTVAATHTQTGKTVTVSIKATVTSVSGAVTFSAPVTGHADTAGQGVGIARMIVGGQIHYGMVSMSAATQITVQIPGTSGKGSAITPTTPATWVAGDQIAFTITYKAA